MTSPEFIQSAATAIHQARELFDAGVKTNLLQTLIEQGHPYGIVLNMGFNLGLVYCYTQVRLR